MVKSGNKGHGCQDIPRGQEGQWQWATLRLTTTVCGYWLIAVWGTSAYPVSLAPFFLQTATSFPDYRVTSSFSDVKSTKSLRWGGSEEKLYLRKKPVSTSIKFMYSPPLTTAWLIVLRLPLLSPCSSRGKSPTRAWESTWEECSSSLSAGLWAAVPRHRVNQVRAVPKNQMALNVLPTFTFLESLLLRECPIATATMSYK